MVQEGAGGGTLVRMAAPDSPRLWLLVDLITLPAMINRWAHWSSGGRLARFGNLSNTIASTMMPRPKKPPMM
jgi:hypothetical protein